MNLRESSDCVGGTGGYFGGISESKGCSTKTNTPGDPLFVQFSSIPAYLLHISPQIVLRFMDLQRTLGCREETFPWRGDLWRGCYWAGEGTIEDGAAFRGRDRVSWTDLFTSKAAKKAQKDQRYCEGLWLLLATCESCGVFSSLWLIITSWLCCLFSRKKFLLFEEASGVGWRESSRGVSHKENHSAAFDMAIGYGLKSNPWGRQVFFLFFPLYQ